MNHKLRFVAVIAGSLLAAGIAHADPLTIKVKEADVGSDKGQPVLNLDLDESAAAAFADFTRANVGKEIELRVDGKTLLTATLRDPILSGKVQVSGQNRDALTDVADRIKSGAAKVEVEAK